MTTTSTSTATSTAPTAAAAYDDAARPLTDLLDAVPAPAFDALSPCEGWTARDVLRHVVESQRQLFAGHGVDLGELPDLDADPVRAWRAHAARVLEVLADDAVPAIAYDGHFGPTTVGATLVQFYVFDMVVHRWDVAQAAGLDADLTDAELERLDRGADSFGDALYMDGICKGGVTAPAGAGREAVVLARLGRVA
jgi:uncharacterized protein (TIGR03086 family)